MLQKEKRLKWLLVALLGSAILVGSTILANRSISTASALPNPPAALTARPTIESAPLPTRVTKNGATILLENPGAAALPTLTAPLEATRAGVAVRLDAIDTQALADGRVEAQVCFSLPSSSLDWSIGKAWLETPTGKWPVTSGVLLQYRKESDGTIWRCEVITFTAPKASPSKKQPAFTRMVIASLQGPQKEQPDCEAIQKALASEGIQVAPVHQQGVGGCDVVSKPADMSLEAAQARVAELLMPQRRGPWEFALQQP